MASEITTLIGVDLLKGLIEEHFPAKSLQFDWAGQNYSKGVQVIGNAAHELLEVSADVGTAGFGLFYNVSETAGESIQLGIDATGTFYPLAKIPPGGMAFLWLDTKNVYAKAASGTPNLQYLICEA